MNKAAAYKKYIYGENSKYLWWLVPCSIFTLSERGNALSVPFHIVEIIVFLYKMSKNSKTFKVQDVIAMLENLDDEIESSDDSLAEDEGDDDGDARGTVEASDRDESDDDGDNFVGRRSQKRPRIPSSDSEEEGEAASSAETSHVESNTAPWTWTSCDDKIFQPADVPFSGREQIMVNLADDAAPHDFFFQYITPAVIEHMVKETNLYIYIS